MHTRALAAAAVVLACVAAAWAAVSEDVDPRWLDRLPDPDRQLLDDLVGYAPPAIPETVTWSGGDRVTWKDLRGKVVVLQSWTSRSNAGRSWLGRLAKLRRKVADPDLVLIALHTPEGVDNAATFIERKGVPVPVIIDRDGVFCDDLGIYRSPANVLVDRRGVVRYVGLNGRGLDAAVPALLAETYDAEKAAPAPTRSTPEPVAEFPPITGDLRGARDVRGQAAPQLVVQQWMTPAPDLRDKIVVIDLWATWCGPCVRSIPHMNAIADAFREDVVVVGLSDESRGAFEQGLMKRNLSATSFRYSLGLDPGKQVGKAIELKGIPHVLVVSRDGIVRWQGLPPGLTKSVLGQIVAADGGGASRRARRWEQATKRR